MARHGRAGLGLAGRGAAGEAGKGGAWIGMTWQAKGPVMTLIVVDKRDGRQARRPVEWDFLQMEKDAENLRQWSFEARHGRTGSLKTSTYIEMGAAVTTPSGHVVLWRTNGWTSGHITLADAAEIALGHAGVRGYWRASEPPLVKTYATWLLRRLAARVLSEPLEKEIHVARVVAGKGLVHRLTERGRHTACDLLTYKARVTQDKVTCLACLGEGCS